MSEELYQYIDELAKVNADLAAKLKTAESEIVSLRLALGDANNEVTRMYMVAKHREESLENYSNLQDSQRPA